MKGLLFVLLVGLFFSVAQAQDTVFVIMAPPPTNAEATNPPPTQIQVIEVQTASPQAEQPIKQKRSRRSSFYLNGSLGPDISTIYYDHRYYSEHTEYEGTGFGFVGDLSLGFLIKEFIAIHGTFEFADISGEYKLDDSDSYDDDFEAVSLLGGAGFTIFPWLFHKPDSFVGGMFISANLLMGVIVLDMPYYFDARDNSREQDYFAFAFNLEMGKDWRISERTYLGVALKWQILGIASGDDMAGEDDYDDYYHHDHTMYSLQLLFRINRK